MRKVTKRIGVGIVAATLVTSTSLVAFAADPAGTGTSTGTGAIEGIVETDVYTADLPVASNTAYAYIADPQGLIRKTDAAKYSGATFGEGTLFFTNKDGSYSNTSDAATIVNKSSKNLSVKVTATATEGTGTDKATLATSSTFSGTNKEVYLGITDSVADNTEKALTTSGAAMTAILGAAPEDAYEYKYDTDNSQYTYSVKNDVSGFKFAEYSFQITGAANGAATDWAADTELPGVSVTWEVDLTDSDATVPTPEQTPEEPSIALSGTYSRANAENTFELSGLGTATVTKVEALNAEGAVFQEITAAMYTLNGNTLKINGATAPWGAGAVGQERGIKITLSDGNSIQTTFTVER